MRTGYKIFIGINALEFILERASIAIPTTILNILYLIIIAGLLHAVLFTKSLPRIKTPTEIEEDWARYQEKTHGNNKNG